MSVVIPCHNYGSFLEAAILSALSQEPAPRAVVVVDDGSTDATARIAREHPVTFVSQSRGGLAAARNAGLREVASEFVVFLDADDTLLPGALRVHEALAAAHECAFACGSFIATRGRDTLTHVPRIGEDAYASFLEGNQAGAIHAVLFRTQPLLDIGGFRVFPGCEDYDAYLRLTRRGRVLAHDVAVASYRMHDAGMSRDELLMLESALACLRDTGAHRSPARRYRAACRAGVRNWKRRYGHSVAHRLRTALMAGDLATAVRCWRALASFRGAGLAGVAGTLWPSGLGAG